MEGEQRIRLIGGAQELVSSAGRVICYLCRLFEIILQVVLIKYKLMITV